MTYRSKEFREHQEELTEKLRKGIDRKKAEENISKMSFPKLYKVKKWNKKYHSREIVLSPKKPKDTFYLVKD